MYNRKHGNIYDWDYSDNTCYKADCEIVGVVVAVAEKAKREENYIKALRKMKELWLEEVC